MIKLLVSIAGDNYSFVPGEEVSLDKIEKGLEKRLIDSGQAEPMKSATKKKEPAKDK